MRKAGVNFTQLDSRFVQINPVTGNKQLIPAANDVGFVVELLGGTDNAAEILGVEEIEIHHWIDDHYVPTRYAEKITMLFKRWDLFSLQVPSIGAEWTSSEQLSHH